MTDQPGVYGVQGKPNATNVPGARVGHAMVFNPPTNEFFMTFGFGFGVSRNGGLSRTRHLFSIV